MDRSFDPRDTAPLPGDDATGSFRPLWKWQALFDRPAPLEPTWQAWLGEAQHAEQDAALLYWAHRHPA